MSDHSVERRARDAALEAQEKVREGRREFCKLVGIGAAVSGVGSALYSASAQAYGGPFAAGFALDPFRTYMDVATTGSTPIAVLKNLAANNAAIARDPTVAFDTQIMRNTIAPGLGAHPFEVAITYGATDSLGMIFNGIQVAPGDELISTNMEHPSTNSPMGIKADRSGMIIRRVNLPTGDYYSDAEVLARFQALARSSTALVSFSSPSWLTGIRLPEKFLCLWAAANGFASIIDGAQGPGMLALNLHDIGCDFYAGSGHKWQCGPGGTGILYVRNLNGAGHTNQNPLPPFWPAFGGYSQSPGATLQGGVRDPSDNVGAVLMSRGNPNFPLLRAFTECCQLWDSWGRQTIENYTISLAQYLRSRIASIWGSQSLATPYNPASPSHSRTALTSFNPFSPGYDYNAVLTAQQSIQQASASNAAVASLRGAGVVVSNPPVPHSLRGNPFQSALANAQSRPLRISTHLFHHFPDVDNLIVKLLAVVPHP
jgi:isopenicillin-N epimerase